LKKRGAESAMNAGINEGERKKCGFRVRATIIWKGAVCIWGGTEEPVKKGQPRLREPWTGSLNGVTVMRADREGTGKKKRMDDEENHSGKPSGIRKNWAVLHERKNTCGGPACAKWGKGNGEAYPEKRFACQDLWGQGTQRKGTCIPNAYL